MNTLQSTSLKDIIHSWESLRQLEETASTENKTVIEGLQGGLYGFFVSEYASLQKSKQIHAIQYDSQIDNDNIRFATDILIVVPNEKDAQELETDLSTFFPDIEILQLPWWGSVPYRPVAKGAAVFGQRAAVLAKMADKSRILSISTQPRICIVTLRAYLTPVPPAGYIRSLLFTIKKGQTVDSVSLAAKLVEEGYTRVPRVTVRGEFTLRGEVLDLFMPAETYATRIVFDFDTIAQIKFFDSENQSSVSTLDSLLIYPMKEILWTDEFISKFEKSFADFNSIQNDVIQEKILQMISELSESRESEGEELFYQRLFDRTYSIADYMNESSTIIFFDYDRLDNSQENFDREYIGLYRKTCTTQPCPETKEILLKFKSISDSHLKSIVFKTIHTDGNTNSIKKIECDPPRSFFGNINFLKETIDNLLKEKWKIFIFADSENQALRISEILKDYTNTDTGHTYNAVVVLPLSISAGFGIPELKTLVIQENEIFGRRKHIPKSIKHVKSAVIDTFVELNPGDYVVHVNYGIGLFKGIERVKALGNERDYIQLEYADEEIVFIPIEQVNLVQRYIGNEGTAPALDRIGSKSWENRKNKVKKSVEDIAQRLIDLYSKRKAARGFAFPKDTEWQTAFEAAFPYEETEDQLTVAEEIKTDMEKPVPMDRLICGDVGYGKTEMSMRAAFKAVMGGKQVALLAPTTILAEQHYESFTERFENFPVKIAHLSRFVPKPEQKTILEKLKKGEIDILIGTHRIIQKDVIFRDLGLLVIDEEQRFGVKDKEKLKELKASVDSLAMSATPIPRTLHMSLLKIRDMSLLATPPQNRHPIETVIDSYNEDRVAAAIRREVDRGGQVFFLHNRVETLEETRLKLEKLVPEMMIDTAHGQMTSQELDDVFRRFKMGGFHVLVATTIIENGIDIPNVNTIIIDRADMYGVSQLYQLRGRVGRSDRTAYAYLLYPEGKTLSEIAMKRLQAISDFTELGSGFKIAMKDMEIRGAGNLLGKDQSGDVYSVGFDMYLRLLEDAVQRLSDENYNTQSEVLMELEYTGFIPDTYIHNSQTKMEVYKKIASINKTDELERMYAELLDRFGPIPDEISSLLSLAEIRIICGKLNISTIRERSGIVRIEFQKVSEISIDRVLRLIRESGGRVKLDPSAPNILLLSTGKIGLKEKSEFIREKLDSLI